MIRSHAIMHQSTGFKILIFTLILSASAFAAFPDEPKPCQHGDSDCIVKVINWLMEKKSAGDNSLNLIAVDPLQTSKIVMQQGESSPVNIDLTFTNNQIIGLKNARAYKVKGFGKDIESKHEVHVKVPNVQLVGDYKITGKVLILPIRGDGKSNMTMINVDLGLHWTGKKFEKDGATYMKVDNLKLTAEPERLFYYFGNLFNGEKELGDNMNLFLNENWKEIYNEVRATLTEAFGKIFQSVANNVFSKYPYEQYFAQ